MKVEWNYSSLARPYLNRPDYAPRGIDRMLEIAGVTAGAMACDIGAGVGHLTIPLLERGLTVDAVEPNDAMRALGAERTTGFPAVSWYEGVGEATGRPNHAFDLITFGSSFNVTDRPKALNETARIGKAGAWFACMWNHRDLDDPLQAEVEALIRSHIPNYDYGVRREDQTAVIDRSGLFGGVTLIEEPVRHRVTVEDWIDAWRSHATLARQAGDRHAAVVDAIGSLLLDRGLSEIDVPYTTRIWIAPLRTA